MNEKRSLTPWGLRVPIWKINSSPSVLRLSELPRCKAAQMLGGPISTKKKLCGNFLTPPLMLKSTKISLKLTETLSKIRLTILQLNKNCRPLLKISSLPLLELRVFTFYLKSTNLTTQVDPSFLLAVVPPNLFSAI